MRSVAPTRLKATTNNQKSGRIRAVSSASIARIPVAKSPYAANTAKLAGRWGLTTPGRMKTSPKKRKLCKVAVARCASNGSIDLSLGQTYTRKQSSQATYPRTRCNWKRTSGDMLPPVSTGVGASAVDWSWRFSAYSGPMQSTYSGPMQDGCCQVLSGALKDRKEIGGRVVGSVVAATARAA